MKFLGQEVLLASDQVCILEFGVETDTLSDGIDALLVLTHSVLGNAHEDEGVLKHLRLVDITVYILRKGAGSKVGG